MNFDLKIKITMWEIWEMLTFDKYILKTTSFQHLCNLLKISEMGRLTMPHFYNAVAGMHAWMKKNPEQSNIFKNSFSPQKETNLQSTK